MHGGLSHGWPGSWALALAARFKENFICGQTNNSVANGMAASLLMKGNKQIDCIFGWGAGIVEMLMQSHQGFVDLLPALPPLWKNGFIKGLKARGGLTVDIAWAEKALTETAVTAAFDGDYEIRYGDKAAVFTLKAGETLKLDRRLERIG
jgi:alpha-L-fucosidase 2